MRYKLIPSPLMGYMQPEELNLEHATYLDFPIFQVVSYNKPCEESSKSSRILGGSSGNSISFIAKQN